MVHDAKKLVFCLSLTVQSMYRQAPCRLRISTERELIAPNFYAVIFFFSSSLSVYECSDKIRDVTDKEAAGGV